MAERELIAALEWLAEREVAAPAAELQNVPRASLKCYAASLDAIKISEVKPADHLLDAVFAGKFLVLNPADLWTSFCQHFEASFRIEYNPTGLHWRCAKDTPRLILCMANALRELTDPAYQNAILSHYGKEQLMDPVSASSPSSRRGSASSSVTAGSISPDHETDEVAKFRTVESGLAKASHPSSAPHPLCTL